MYVHFTKTQLENEIDQLRKLTAHHMESFEVLNLFREHSSNLRLTYDA